MNALRRWLRRPVRWMAQLLRGLSRLVYILLVTVAAVVLWLLLTTSGAQWLAERAMDEEQRLTVKVVGGSLWNGLEVRRLRWRGDGIDVAAGRAELQWNHLCLLQRQVCVGLAHVEQLAVSVDTQRLAGEETSGAEDAGGTGDERVSLPVALSFPDVRIQQADVRVDGHRVQWADLRLGGDFSDGRLTLDKFNWETILLELAEAAPARPGEAAASGPGFLETGWQALELPAVQLPLDIILHDLRLHDLRVMQGDELLRISRFSAVGALRGHEVRLDQLEVVHPRGRLKADGRLSMRDDWPVDLEIDAEGSELPVIGSGALQAQVWNSIGDLEFRVSAQGPGALSLEGSVAPGKDQLPLDIRGEWNAIGWPLDTRAQVRTRNGTFVLAGDLGDYQLDLGVTVEGEGIPEGRWQLEARGDLQGARVESLRGEVLDGTVAASGQAAWAPEVEWQADVRLDGIDADAYWPAAPGGITGDLRTSGGLREQGLALSVDVPGVTASVEGHELALRGGVDRPAGGDWTLEDVRLTTGDSAVTVAGRVGADTVDLDGRVDIADLGAITPDASGTLRGRVEAAGPLAKPDISADLEATGLAWGELGRIGTARLQGRVAALGDGAGQVRLELRDAEAGGQSLRSLDATLEGRRGDHALTLDADAERGAVSLRMAGSLAGSLDWQGRMERAAVTLAGQQWTLNNATAVNVDAEAPRARIQPHCWQHDTSRLCAPAPVTLGAQGDARVRLERFDLAQLAPLLPDVVALDGSLAADVSARWGESALPEVTVDARVDGGRVRLTDPDAESGEETDLTLPYQELSLRGRLDGEALETALRLRSESLGSMDVTVSAPLTEGDDLFGPMDGSVEITDVHLGLVAPFFPELRTLEGTLSASGRLAGELTAPRYHGTVQLADGRLEPAALGIDLQAIQLQLDVDGSSAALEGEFRSGEGAASVTGEADWSGAPTASLRLSGSDLRVVYEPIADVRVDPDIDVDFREGRLRVSGRLGIPRGEITLAELPESAVRVSDDVVIVDREQGGTAPDEEAPPVPEGIRMETDIRLVLGDDVNISGYGITGRLVGDLRLEQLGSEVPQGNGEIRIEDGEYRAYGQRLQIREGQMIFAGPLDRPQLYVEAVRRIERDDVTAGLRLEGNPEEPRVSLFSEPAMAEETILSYIILGRPPGESGPGGGTMMARAAVALGVAGGGGYATVIADELGVEDFTLDTAGDGEDTRVEVGGYINPNLYLGYGVGVFTPVSTLTLRYRLASNLYLEAVTGLESAVDLLYRFDFG
ncbi:translocation/assembly module TamB domain-containing protein [Aquisalimonas lutea]|uniref:autotransporter assembly complex protein TamB n=1 Tax=Aquisalimonas lutea TaxID=1327750 RepID=UPI0025B541A4|nr:translocation/assembly module TamB domain-containing protein [Aquisalimonas lutea]MDN3518620.1 translocation/assembly module TamB domain-containing protein [Aquisalimonas lutea]